jgi:hypothetical protein
MNVERTTYDRPARYAIRESVAGRLALETRKWQAEATIGLGAAIRI